MNCFVVIWLMTEIIQRERRPEILELMAPRSVRLRFPSGEFFRLICLPGAVESGGKSLRGGWSSRTQPQVGTQPHTPTARDCPLH